MLMIEPLTLPVFKYVSRRARWGFGYAPRGGSARVIHASAAAAAEQSKAHSGYVLIPLIPVLKLYCMESSLCIERSLL